jgi:hypothetical protein
MYDYTYYDVGTYILKNKNKHNKDLKNRILLLIEPKPAPVRGR